MTRHFRQIDSDQQVTHILRHLHQLAVWIEILSPSRRRPTTLNVSWKSIGQKIIKFQFGVSAAGPAKEKKSIIETRQEAAYHLFPRDPNGDLSPSLCDWEFVLAEHLVEYIGFPFSNYHSFQNQLS